MTNIISIMEVSALRCGSAYVAATPDDHITIEYHVDYKVGQRFVYRHNGVPVERRRVLDLCPHHVQHACEPMAEMYEDAARMLGWKRSVEHDGLISEWHKEGTGRDGYEVKDTAWDACFADGIENLDQAAAFIQGHG